MDFSNDEWFLDLLREGYSIRYSADVFTNWIAVRVTKDLLCAEKVIPMSYIVDTNIDNATIFKDAIEFLVNLIKEKEEGV